MSTTDARLRRQSKGNFTIIANDCFKDAQLSAEALGVICYLRSKPADWVVMPTELSNRFGCGRDRVLRILKELISLGYLLKVRNRDPQTKAWKPVEYVIPDMANEPLTENTEVATPTTENPSTGKPVMENPSMANPTLLRTDSTNERKELNTDGQIARETRLVTAADWPADYADVFWSRYPNKKSKGHALKALDKIYKAGKTRFVDLINGLERYKLSRDVQRGFVKHPATWLNGQCWTDQEQTTPLPVEKPQSFFELAEESWSRAKAYEAGTDPDEQPIY